jgi:hypothetical protein
LIQDYKVQVIVAQLEAGKKPSRVGLIIFIIALVAIVAAAAFLFIQKRKRRR